MPRLTLIAREIALMIIPLLIMAVNIIGLCAKKHNGVDSILIFNLIVQFSTLAWYVAVFRGLFYG